MILFGFLIDVSCDGIVSSATVESIFLLSSEGLEHAEMQNSAVIRVKYITFMELILSANL